MCAVIAGWAFGAEAGEIEGAYVGLLVVLECAMWAEWTESAIVVGARRALRFGVDVEV